ncbi:MAG TPA: uroporphyrinogen decarboxylase [Longimicrobiales bacterium]|nr:uroporphyrinogen decarboxylase [Longimicrobiales bacterium]
MTCDAGAELLNDRILRALRREPVDCTPVWLMRQAGRSLPRYHESRAEREMFDLLKDPAAAADITAMPLDYYEVDAAVLYNDLSTPYFAAGFDVEMRRGVGPVVHNPIERPEDVDRLVPFDPRDALDYNLDQIRLLVQRLDVPVLGFVGAPFTLCSYLISGHRSRDLAEIKTFMFTEPHAWHRLADFWARHMADFAVAQHEAGAGAVQVFDSWAGSLSPQHYEEYLFPHMRTIFARLEEAGVPSINFFNGNPALLPLVARAGGDAVSVDWRLPIDEAWQVIGEDRAIQGNLDPCALLAGEDFALSCTKDILDRVGGRPGHIFNLGHGILAETDWHVARAVIDFVHEYTRTSH